MSIEEIVQSWKRSRAVSSCITDIRIFKKKEGEYAPFPEFLHPLLKGALKTAGIERLYCHQAEAIEAAHRGRNVVVVTPTASGKTLCYNLPVLHERLTNPSSKALYLFPTKALSQDQMVELQATAERIGGADCNLYLRWRHPSGCPGGHTEPGRYRDQQSRHAPYRDPSPSHQMALFFSESQICGDR